MRENDISTRNSFRDHRFTKHVLLILLKFVKLPK